MSVKYVSDFTFDGSDGFSGSTGQQIVKGYARGGHVKATTPKPFAAGGVAGGAKGPHPGSFKRTPPGPKAPNKAIANSKFAAKIVAPVTKQKGQVFRASGWSDYATGGRVPHSMGGLARGTSPKRNAAIHAKGVRKPGLGKIAKALTAMGGLTNLAPASTGLSPPTQGSGMGMPPQGMPGMPQPMKRGGKAR